MSRGWIDRAAPEKAVDRLTFFRLGERYYAQIMAVLDPAGEYLRVAEHYRSLRDEELLVIARRPSELTDVAQQALESELFHRRLEVPREESQVPQVALSSDFGEPAEEVEDRYAEDRRLVEICKVWSPADALRVQWLLDRAGIPFYMGAEGATGVDSVTSNFASGVGVKVMQIGVPWALQALSTYAPADQPVRHDEPPISGTLVRCPKCHSTDIIFERLIPVPGTEEDDQRFLWVCDACGQRWDDEGTSGD